MKMSHLAHFGEQINWAQLTGKVINALLMAELGEYLVERSIARPSPTAFPLKSYAALSL